MTESGTSWRNRPRERDQMQHMELQCYSLEKRRILGANAGENSAGSPHGADLSLVGAESCTMSDATVMLAAINAGDSKAARDLLVLVYDELRRLAASKLA